MKARLTAVVVVLSVGVVLAIVLAQGREEPGVAIISDPDLSDHPIYSAYEFGTTEDVIDIGTQPFLLPTGLITEAMKRDAVLRDALQSLGLEVRFHPFLKGFDVNYFLGGGQLEAGVSGDMPTITAAADLDVLITSLIQLGFTSIVANQPMLTTELRGKVIGYPYGSNAHHGLLSALASEGIAESQVTLVPMDVDEMPQALLEGKIDAFSAWEPFPAVAAIIDPESAVVHRSSGSGYMYFSKIWAETYPDAARLIVAAEIRAVRWMLSDPQNLLKASEWANSAGRELSPMSFEFSAEQTAVLARRDILGLHSNTVIPLSFLEVGGRLQREFQFLQELDKIPSTASWDQARGSFDQSLANQVLSKPNTYRLQEFQYGAVQGSQQ